jgi:DNA primase
VSAAKNGEERDGVALTHLDDPLFDGANATKRDLIDYIDGVADRLVPVLEDRPLSVIRVHRGQEAFMQKNLPKYTPDWVPRISLWAETSKRDVTYAMGNDRRTLIWFANQRAIEYHPTLVRADRLDHMTHLVLDLDPPGDAFAMAVRAAHVVRAALDQAGLRGALKRVAPRVCTFSCRSTSKRRWKTRPPPPEQSRNAPRPWILGSRRRRS